MEDMAKRDGLTKIYNRIHFNHFYDEMLTKIKSDGGTISVLMADIDHFKKVNDTFGHLAGDEAIKALAKLDEAIAKKYGCEAVRFGGEEFLLIMNGKSLDEAYKIAEEFHSCSPFVT
jgi:diguanylate cyclase (GGDEF)-like protein